MDKNFNIGSKVRIVLSPVVSCKAPYIQYMPPEEEKIIGPITSPYNGMTGTVIDWRFDEKDKEHILYDVRLEKPHRLPDGIMIKVLVLPADNLERSNV